MFLSLVLKQTGLPDGDEVAAVQFALVLLVAGVLEHVTAQVAQEVGRVAAVGPRAPVPAEAGELGPAQLFQRRQADHAVGHTGQRFVHTQDVQVGVGDAKHARVVLGGPSPSSPLSM